MTATLHEDIKNTRISEDGKFAIVKSVKEVSADKLLETGYPFFTGKVTFAKTIAATGNETVLRLSGRYAIAKVEIGGVEKMVMFDNKVDITGMLKEGENEVKITLMGARRNTLGPFHVARDVEPFGVSPDTFSKYGAWDGAKNPRYADRYSFVFFGLTDIEIG